MEGVSLGRRPHTGDGGGAPPPLNLGSATIPPINIGDGPPIDANINVNIPVNEDTTNMAILQQLERMQQDFARQREDFARQRENTDRQLELQRQQIQALVANNPVEAADRRRRAELAWQNDAYTRASRKAAYVAQGFSEEQAESFVQEPVVSTATSTPASVITTPPAKRREWQVKDIGTFDGNPLNLDKFLSRVLMLYEARQEPGWREPLLETLPLCLTGAASEWIEGQTLDWKLANLNTMDNWVASLRSFFSGDLNEKEAAAHNRKWDFKQETVAAYFFAKTRLLQSAYPYRDKDSMLNEVIKGVPETMQINLRTSMMNHPTSSALLKEIQWLEGPWRRIDPARRSLKDSQSSHSPPPADNTGNTNVSVTVKKEEPQAKNHLPATAHASLRQRESLRKTFNPNNLYKRDGKDCYRRPDTGQVLIRDRNCQTCGGPHFDFSHDHIVSMGIKQEAHMIAMGAYWSEYPTDDSFSSQGSGSADSPILLSPSDSADSRRLAISGPGSDSASAIEVCDSSLN